MAATVHPRSVSCADLTVLTKLVGESIILNDVRITCTVTCFMLAHSGLLLSCCPKTCLENESELLYWTYRTSSSHSL